MNWVIGAGIFLEWFELEYKDFLSSIVIEDKTWIAQYTKLIKQKDSNYSGGTPIHHLPKN